MDEESERSQILEDFQACTGIDNIEVSMDILAACGWNLSEAVTNFFSDGANSRMGFGPDPYDETGRYNSSPEPPPMNFAINRILQPSPLSAREVVDELGVSRRILDFTVSNKDRLIYISLPDSKTVADLKQQIADQFSLSTEDFTICWENQRLNVEDHNRLSELSLPRDNSLQIVMHVQSPFFNRNTVAARRNSLTDSYGEDYSLRIKYSNGAHSEEHDLVVPGTTTVYEVKEQVQRLAKVPINEQQWKGWPESVSDNLTVAACNLTFPKHFFSVTKKNSTSSSSSSSRSQPSTSHVVHTISDSDDSVCDESLDDTADIDIEMVEQLDSSSKTTLIPANVLDTTEALDHFNTEFKRRYGCITCPVFYMGSLEAAVNEALQVNPRDRRLLAIYLHHDSSIAANVFCSQVLCSETVVSYISTNFVLWGWDLTLTKNRALFQNACERVLGRSAVDYVRRLTTDQLPVLIIVSRVRGTLEILSTTSATVTSEELMGLLLHADDIFQQQKALEVQEDDERVAREEMKRVQDAAYEESLAADQLKEYQRQQEEKAKEEQLKKQEREEKEKQAIKQSAARNIPEEPPLTSKEPMANLKIRCPGGEVISRRFLGSNSLHILLNYLLSKGYSHDDYKVLTTFPRRDLTQESEERTLEELKLCPQETLILEAR